MTTDVQDTLFRIDETTEKAHDGGGLPPGFRLQRLELLNWGTFHGGGADLPFGWRQQPVDRRYRFGKIDCGGRDHDAPSAGQSHRVQQGRWRAEAGTHADVVCEGLP